MVGIVAIVIVVAALLYFAKRGVPGHAPKTRDSINPDFISDTIAINSQTGAIWMRDRGKERIVSKDLVRGMDYRWSNYNAGIRGTLTRDHHIVFNIQDMAEPRFVVNFFSPKQAEEWHQRLKVFLNL